MNSLDKTSKKNFPWIIILATIAAVGLVVLFQDPLSYLRDILAEDNLIITSLLYACVLAVSVVISRFSIAPAVPFVAKILTPELTFILTIGGWTVGSCAAYLIANKGREGLINRVYPVATVEQNQYQLHTSPSFVTLLQARLFAALDNFSYFVGLKTNVSFLRFFVLTLVGSVPAAFIFSFSADAIADGEKITLFGLFFATSLIALAYISHKGWALFERPAHVYTELHSYRAGEILAVAGLSLFFEKRNKPFKIHRVAGIEKIIKKRASGKKSKEVYVCIESEKLDEMHNIFGSVDAGVRGNNIPYGVFGSLWKKYGTAICGSDVAAQKIEQDLVVGIDAEDAGIRHEDKSDLYIDQWSLSEILEKTYGDIDPKSLHHESDHQHFMKAVVFAKEFLRRIMAKQSEIHTQEARESSSAV